MPEKAKFAAASRYRGIRRTFPLFGLLLYYAGLVAAAALLISYVPGFQDALVSPINGTPISQAADILTGGKPVAAVGTTQPFGGIVGRGLLALTAMAWALAVVIPVAWTLMRTRRLRYDPSLVHTLLLLPIVVAGVVLVVKNSLALAFALAAIVAGVRFRQKLDEPEEAVYVLLALGIGLAAGVQALDIALVMSMMFTVVVMTFWRFDIGDIYAKGKGAQLTIGDWRLLGNSTRSTAKAMLKKEVASDDGIDADGLLVLSTSHPDRARRAIELVATRLASEWRMTEPVHDDSGFSRFDTFIKLKKGADAAELVAELEARWADVIVAATFVPYSGGSKG
jgi:hypothetical protein